MQNIVYFVSYNAPRSASEMLIESRMLLAIVSLIQINTIKSGIWLILASIVTMEEFIFLLLKIVFWKSFKFVRVHHSIALIYKDW